MSFLVNNLLMGATTWIMEVLSWICIWIDSMIYQLVAAFYKIFLALSKFTFEDANAMFDNVLNRIYVVLGIVMLFRISFSLLQFLANPERVTDSKTGGTALAKHIFISIVMLISFPLVFDLLGDLQKAVLDNGLIEKVVLGDGAEILTSNPDAAGPAFSWSLMQSFLHPKGDPTNWSINTKVKAAYDGVWDGQDFSLLQFNTVVNSPDIEYTPLVSTIVGIAMIYFLCSFSLDIGIRMFKLFFLEVIAPIPIIAYMSPGKGEDVFNRYRDTYIGTYVELFIRLAIIYFALLLANSICTMIFDTNNITLTGLSLGVARVILIIALFNFAKKIPDFLGKIFNVQIGSGGSNGMGGLIAAGLGAAGLVGGAALAGTSSLAGSVMRGDFLNDQGQLTAGGLGKVAANALAGAARGGVSAGRAGIANKGAGIGAVGASLANMSRGVRNSVSRQATISDSTRAAGGWWNMTKGRIDNATGGGYRAARRLQQHDDAISGAQKDMDAAKGTMDQFSSMRHIAEQQYAQQNHMTVDEARKASGASFEREVDNWISTQGAGNETFMTALQNHNAANNTNVTTATFADAQREATDRYQTAAGAYNAASGRKKTYLETGGALGTNAERAKNREAANNRTGANH